MSYEYKVSVVVLVYNTEYYLHECLDSLVNQTLDDIEIICVNDESTDNSLNILKQYARKYDNITIIDQKNQGGAVAGNNGLKIAKGEYVAIIDSDDVVVEDAYEKLYKKAKETDSDIVAGKPNKFVGKYQREIVFKHNIWDEERTFTVDEFKEIYYDVFYWNKLYRRKLVEEHDIYMIPGKIYADVPLVFRAYSFADKISIIPDVVYYWRRRDQEDIIKGNSDTSISKSLQDIPNMRDRLSTFYYAKEYFEEAGMEKYFNYAIKTYMERFFYPIKGILKDETFKWEYLKEMKSILSNIDDIYDNDLDKRYNIFFYFILNDMDKELEDFLNFDLFERSTVTRDGKVYWNLKYFDNPEYNIPDELFEIKKIEDNFINIDEISADSKYIYFNNIALPQNVDLKEVKVSFMGLTKIDTLKAENVFEFMLDETDDHVYSGKVNVEDIRNINVFDIHLKVKYGDDTYELFRFKEKFFKKDNNEIVGLNKNKYLEFTFTNFGNFSIVNGYCRNFFKYRVDEHAFTLIPETAGNARYKVTLNYKYDDVYFTPVDMSTRLKLQNELELIWKYSLDENTKYSLYVKNYYVNFKLKKDAFVDFKDQTIDYNGKKIRIFEDSDGSIAILLK
ncbi:glycosyltransferase [Methanobrevibacter sp.]|uniref:glycosyltransferase n=1 Tax=Methanobrevibacter sp. TaxID=66852 RepID=UPI002E79949E|nr:glycosyltransferase [Methanobrevibacter sp.]MEE1335844.1 glycosyltransferase [Methanobrevibacter sp.]